MASGVRRHARGKGERTHNSLWQIYTPLLPAHTHIMKGALPGHIQILGNERRMRRRRRLMACTNRRQFFYSKQFEFTGICMAARSSFRKLFLSMRMRTAVEEGGRCGAAPVWEFLYATGEKQGRNSSTNLSQSSQQNLLDRVLSTV